MPRPLRLSERVPTCSTFVDCMSSPTSLYSTPSLFVTIRKRISEEELNKMTVKLLNKQRRLLEEKRKREEEETKKNDEEPPTPEPEEPNAASFTDSKGREHNGVLKIDATCADAEMRYPVDVDIIHDGCRKVTDYIMKVCEMFELHKPRTNYKHARQAYLPACQESKEERQDGA